MASAKPRFARASATCAPTRRLPAPVTKATLPGGIECSLRENLLDRPMSLFHQPDGATEDRDFHFPVVETKLLQNGGVQVAIIMAVGDRLIAHVVGGAMGDPAPDAAAREPGRVASGVVIAPGR